MTKNTLRILLASTCVVAFAGAASAEISGYGGLNYTIHSGTNGSFPGGDYSSTGPGLEGGFAYSLGGGTAFVTAEYNQYFSGDEDNDPFDVDNDGHDFNVTGTYLFDLNGSTHVGGFVTLGHSLPSGSDSDNWTYYGIGGEVQHAFSDMITGYAQLAVVNAENNEGGSSAQGAQSSPFVRVGLNYNVTPSTTLFADVQLANLNDFEDAGESWRWGQLSLGGETLIEGTNLAVNFELSLYETEEIEGNDGDFVQDGAAASLGVRYYFGAPQTARSQGIIGAPSSIAISAMFPELHD